MVYDHAQQNIRRDQQIVGLASMPPREQAAMQAQTAGVGSPRQPSPLESAIDNLTDAVSLVEMRMLALAERLERAGLLGHRIPQDTVDPKAVASERNVPDVIHFQTGRIRNVVEFINELNERALF